MNLTCVDVELLHFYKMFFRWAENCRLCRGCDDPRSYDDTKMEACQDGNQMKDLNISYEFVKVLFDIRYEYFNPLFILPFRKGA